jgi:hypothetical protein
VYGMPFDELPQTTYTLCGQPIPVVAQYTYLGIIFHHMGDWWPHLSKVMSRARYKLYNLGRAGMARDGLPPERNRSLVWSQFCSLWEYGSGAFMYSPEQEQVLDAMFTKLVRKAAGVQSYVSIEPLLRDLDLLEAIPSRRYKMYRINMFRKVISMARTRWVRRAMSLWDKVEAAAELEWHNASRGLGRNGTPMPPLGRPPARTDTWTARVYKDLSDLGLQSLFNEPFPTMSKEDVEWKVFVKEHLFEYSQALWRRDMLKKPHLRTYASNVPDVHYFTRVIEVEIEDAVVEVEIRQKEKTFCPFLRSPHRRKRQFHLYLRADALPVQCPHNEWMKNFRCGGLHGSETCFVCNQAPETKDHFLYECPGYASVKERYASKVPSGQVDLGALFGCPSLHKDQVSMVFDMWKHRSNVWIRSFSKGRGVIL